VLRLLAEERIDVETLITHRFPLEKTQLAFEMFADPTSEAVKVVVEP
jgi:threonine dehydrogenase-like Zn-dependent dehydrogenase